MHLSLLAQPLAWATSSSSCPGGMIRSYAQSFACSAQLAWPPHQYLAASIRRVWSQVHSSKVQGHHTAHHTAHACTLHALGSLVVCCSPLPSQCCVPHVAAYSPADRWAGPTPAHALWVILGTGPAQRSHSAIFSRNKDMAVAVVMSDEQHTHSICIAWFFWLSVCAGVGVSLWPVSSPMYVLIMTSALVQQHSADSVDPQNAVSCIEVILNPKHLHITHVHVQLLHLHGCGC